LRVENLTLYPVMTSERLLEMGYKSKNGFGWNDATDAYHFRFEKKRYTPGSHSELLSDAVRYFEKRDSVTGRIPLLEILHREDLK